mmetsp:Transcript_111605/g.296625  ORF Transcript_111605/g.296625 Transcript_111605/m.296625 type:complete len:217 (-) Transcript_111605:74-724(-)
MRAHHALAKLGGTELLAQERPVWPATEAIPEEVIDLVLTYLLVHDPPADLAEPLPPALAAHLDRTAARRELGLLLLQTGPAQGVLTIDQPDAVAFEAAAAGVVKDVGELPLFQATALGLVLPERLIQVEHHGPAGVTAVSVRHHVAVLVLLCERRRLYLQLLYDLALGVRLLLPASTQVLRRGDSRAQQHQHQPAWGRESRERGATPGGERHVRGS